MSQFCAVSQSKSEQKSNDSFVARKIGSIGQLEKTVLKRYEIKFHLHNSRYCTFEFYLEVNPKPRPKAAPL